MSYIINLIDYFYNPIDYFSTFTTIFKTLIAMLPILTIPDIDHTILHLSVEEQGNPVAAVLDFCDEYTVGDTRSMIQTMHLAALLDDRCNDPHERDRQISFCDRLTRALEACYLICNHSGPNSSGV